METADRPFEDFRARPDRDTLRALLKFHQSTVFNVCFQVLRREHDAEDAAQEALLEIVRGAAGIREPRAFKRWLCRTALHTALDHLRRRQRRARHEEARAAMKPVPPDLPADAIHEALARLDDDDRCLLVEKYFERATLGEIGARDGISAAAAGKRVDRAKARLKQRLVQAGMTAIIPRVDSALEGVRPAAVVPDLVSASPALESALTLAGGAAVGAKFTLNATTVIVGLLLLSLGGGGIVVMKRRDSVTADSGRPAMIRPPGPASESGPEAHPNPPVDPEGMPEERATPPAHPDPAELLSRLDRMRKWLDEKPAVFKTAADVERWFQGLKLEADGLKELILENPGPFLDWISRPGNGRFVSNLFLATISGKDSFWATPAQPFSAFPPELTKGLLELLYRSDDFIRTAILQFGLTLKDAPASWRDRYVDLLSDPGVLIPQLAAQALLNTGDLSVGEAGGVIGYLEKLTDFDARANLIHAIGRVDKPEIRDWLLTTLESEKFSDPEGRLTFAGLQTWLEPGRTSDAAFAARAARILDAAIRRVRDPQGYFYLLFGGMTLPLAEARVLLTLASAGAPSEQLRRAAAAMLARPDAELSDGNARRVAWLDAYWAK